MNQNGEFVEQSHELSQGIAPVQNRFRSCVIVLPAAWGRIATDTAVEMQPFYGLI